MKSVQEWWERHLALSERFRDPAALALAGGFAADRPGFAFGSGYQAAGHSLFAPHPAAWPRAELSALCASEARGAHPRYIEARLTRDPDGGLRLWGEKSFVSFGPEASRWLVVAHEGIEDGRKKLRVASISPREGARVEVTPALPFVPEVPHGRLLLDGARLEPEELLPGDGYLLYLKPFRTVEDIHVMLALLAWLLAVARRGRWPEGRIEALLAPIFALCALASASPSSPSTHIGLAGARAAAQAAIDSLTPHWPSALAADRERWERDRALLAIAEKVRQKRRAAAWRELEGASKLGA